jgi:hypothetical protein
LSENTVSELFFNLKDWRAWAPDRDTIQAWQNWAGVRNLPTAEPPGEMEWPESESVPMMLRRRAGPLGQKAIMTALGCGAESDRYIFASRHGELARTVGILGSLADEETPSPAEFSMSVHHAIASLLSIHTRNHQGHSAVAAGVDTFAFGFLEALAVIATEPGASVLLVYYDAPLPEAYAEIEPLDDPEQPLVLALRLSSPTADAPVYAFDQRPAAASGSGRATRSDQAPLDFLRFLLGDESAMNSVGARMDWQWRRVA